MGFVAQARAVWGVVKDKMDDSGETRIFSPIKTNLSVKVKGLSYELIGGRVEFDAEPVEESIDESLRESPATDLAVDFLSEILAGGSQVEQSNVMERAKERNIKPSTVRRAKKKLGVHSTQTTDGEGRKYWFWSLLKNE
jgi:hypothetical protein